jgi:uncharacterized protein
MNGDKKQARRYHRHSEELKSFVDEPHSAIDGPAQGEIVNLTDKRAEHSRAAQLKLLAGLGPDRIVSELSALSDEVPAQAMLPHLVMPAHHDVRSSDVFVRRLHGTLAAAAELGPVDFPELLLIPGVGARTIRSLAMVAEVVHGAPYRFQDPARFSLAHGGKDRHPYPVPLKIYDETLRVMKSAVQKAKLGRDEQLQALKRLDRQARRLEAVAGPPLESYLAIERASSPALGGRSVFGWENDLRAKKVTPSQPAISTWSGFNGWPGPARRPGELSSADGPLALPPPGWPKTRTAPEPSEYKRPIDPCHRVGFANKEHMPFDQVGM